MIDDAYDVFRDAYVETLLWSSSTWDDSGEMGPSLHSLGYEPDDLSEAADAEVDADCEGFFAECRELIRGREADAGQGFALTRNGHGAGFWDGGWPEHGGTLTYLAKAYGSQYLDIGDDGEAHCHG